MGLTSNCFSGPTVIPTTHDPIGDMPLEVLPQLAQCVHLGLPRTHASLHCSQAAGFVRGSLTFCGPQGPHLGTQHGHPWETYGARLGHRLPRGASSEIHVLIPKFEPKVLERELGSTWWLCPPWHAFPTLTRWEVWILTAAPLRRYHKVTAQYHAISL